MTSWPRRISSRNFKEIDLLPLEYTTPPDIWTVTIVEEASAAVLAPVRVG